MIIIPLIDFKTSWWDASGDVYNTRDCERKIVLTR